MRVKETLMTRDVNNKISWSSFFLCTSWGSAWKIHRTKGLSRRGTLSSRDIPRRLSILIKWVISWKFDQSLSLWLPRERVFKAMTSRDKGQASLCISLSWLKRKFYMPLWRDCLWHDRFTYIPKTKELGSSRLTNLPFWDCQASPSKVSQLLVLQIETFFINARKC